MKPRIIASFLAVILLAADLASAGDSPDKKRGETRKMAALARFLNSGWSGSGQADAAAKISKSGGA